MLKNRYLLRGIRSFSSNAYKYGFNRMEKDEESGFDNYKYVLYENILDQNT